MERIFWIIIKWVISEWSSKSSWVESGFCEFNKRKRYGVKVKKWKINTGWCFKEGRDRMYVEGNRGKEMSKKYVGYVIKSNMRW